MSSRLGEKYITRSNVVVVSKYVTFHKSMKNYDRAQQITSRHIKTLSNHSSSRQDIVFRYAEYNVGFGYVFRFRRTVRKLYFTPQNLQESQPQPFCAN